MSTVVSRFEEKYIPEPNSGCWLWTAQVSTSGYGRFCVSKDDRDYAHHVSYRIHKGVIPKGLVVRHTCDVKTCVNPEHLLLGTPEDNYEDARKRQRYHKGENHRLSKLTESQVQEIRTASGPQKAIAARFGISQAMVSCIRTGKNWRG